MTVQKLLFTLFLAFICYSTYSQTFICPDITNSQTMEEAFITITGVTCDDMGNMDPNDDVITFTVSGENGNSSQALTGFPVWPPTISMSGYLNLDNMNEELNIWAGNSAFSEIVMAESPGCTPINLTLDWGGGSGANCGPDAILLNPLGIAVPTLTEWAIISLSLCLCIIGVVTLRQKNGVLT